MSGEAGVIAKQQLLWAIDVGTLTPWPRLVGRYWYEDGWPAARGPRDNPFETRLFATRDEARDFLRKMKARPGAPAGVRSARVVRAAVTIRVRKRHMSDVPGHVSAYRHYDYEEKFDA
ncbi:MAG: hypothetical protein ACRDGM_19185 [bacterium]